MTRRRVVITGLGMATCHGLYVEETWEKVLAGKSGIRKISYPDTAKSAVQAVGAIPDEDVRTIAQEFPAESAAEGELKTMIALWSASQAFKDAGLTKERGNRFRYGASIASGIGVNRLEDIRAWMFHDNSFDMQRFGREFTKAHPESIMKNLSHRPSSLVAKTFDLRGPNATVTAACASATQAIGIGFRAIQRGEADIMAVGGSDVMMNPVGLIFFVLVNAASTLAEDPASLCRPFDRKRSGLVMADGAAVAILEEESHARARGAKIYAELAGYGSSLDAWQLTRPHPEARGAVQSMVASLRDAGMGAGDIDYINAHGTGTKLNDVVETLGIKKTFGERAPHIPVSSSKSMIGHTLAASGAPEFVFTVLSVARDMIHPTINLSQPDPKCDLDYVPNVMRKHVVRAALSNSFGFGGQNASVIVKKYSKETK